MTLHNTLIQKPYMISKINTFVWALSLIFFIGNCTFIVLTTFSVIERQSVAQNTRVLSSEISSYELQYLQKEKEFSMDALGSFGFVTPKKMAFTQKASWFAFYTR